MQTSVQTLENCKTILTLTADKEEWKSKIEKAYKKLESKVNLKGFRKGKAPEEMLRSQVKVEDVFNEALNNFLNENFYKALTDNNLKPIMQPTVDVTKITMEELECTLTVIEEPKVELGAYTGLKIEKDEVSVSDEEVEVELKKLQEQNAEVVTKADGVVSKGDIATIDFEGFVDGVAFDGGKATDYDLEIGSNTFVPGFEDQLVGMKTGETRDVNIKFPQNYVENLKGKDATFKVTIKAVKNKVYPEINDDLALDANLDTVENLEQLKNYYKDQIKTRKEQEASNAAYSKLMEKIIDSSKITIAKEMVDDEVHHNLEHIEERLHTQGLHLDGYLEMLKMSKDEYMSKLEEDCTKNLKHLFTLMAIAKKESITVGEEDFDKAYQEIADQYKMSAEDVKKALENRKDALANDILNRKVNDFLKAQNNL